jgi:hypothetical protein
LFDSSAAKPSHSVHTLMCARAVCSAPDRPGEISR